MASLLATLANTETKTDVVDLKGKTASGLYIPSGFSGTTVTFEASLDGSTDASQCYQVYDGGSALSVTVAAGKYVALDPSKFIGIRYLRLVSGTAQVGTVTIPVAAR